MGLRLLQPAAQPVFDAGAEQLEYSPPEDRAHGDLLVAVIVSDPAEATFTTPDGWSVMLATVGATNAVIAVIGKVLEEQADLEAESFIVEVPGGTKERMGFMFGLRGGMPSLALESSANAVFTATMTATPAPADCQQAINLALVLWSWSGAAAITLDAAYDELAAYQSSVLQSRSLAVGLRVVNDTGLAIALEAGTFGANQTGRSFSLIFRDRRPVVPTVLVDPVPGNIGLVGKDLRR